MEYGRSNFDLKTATDIKLDKDYVSEYTMYNGRKVFITYVE